jgi:hypothetical protein
LLNETEAEGTLKSRPGAFFFAFLLVGDPQQIVRVVVIDEVPVGAQAGGRAVVSRGEGLLEKPDGGIGVTLAEGIPALRKSPGGGIGR